jgi:hypothetical protein
LTFSGNCDIITLKIKERRKKMAGCVVFKGSRLSASEIYDGWGEAPDEVIEELVQEQVARTECWLRQRTGDPTIWWNVGMGEILYEAVGEGDDPCRPVHRWSLEVTEEELFNKIGEIGEELLDTSN